MLEISDHRINSSAEGEYLAQADMKCILRGWVCLAQVDMEENWLDPKLLPLSSHLWRRLKDPAPAMEWDDVVCASSQLHDA